MRQVDRAGSEVNQGHGDALPLQSGKLVEVDPAELESVDEVGWFGSAKAEREVVLVEQSYRLLQAVGGVWTKTAAVVSICYSEEGTRRYHAYTTSRVDPKDITTTGSRREGFIVCHI